MKKNQKYSVAAGIVLFVLAALFSISLLLVAIDFGGISPTKSSFFYSVGKMFTGVYGISSLCIPIFLIIAGIQCFSANWRIRNGVLLLGSVVPFFTLDAIEHICRMIVTSDSDSVMVVKLGSTLLIGALILAAEYLLLSILGDVLENSLSKSDDYDFITEESDSADDEEILFDADADDAEDDKKQPSGALDLSTDKIFLQQKELLKDLINDGKPSETPAEPVVEKTEPVIEEKPLETPVAESRPPVAETGEPILEENAPVVQEEEEPIEEVLNDEVLEEEEFSEPALPEEESPFAHIFDEQEKALDEEFNEPFVEQEEEDFTEPAPEDFVDQNAETEIVEPIEDEIEEQFEDVSDDENEIHEEAIPINPDDFLNESDDASLEDAKPVALPVEVSAEDEAEPLETEVEQEEENPADYINLEDIADADSEDESMGVEDIFSQMEADAAAHPVMKNQPVVAHDSLYQPERVDNFDEDIMSEDVEKDVPTELPDEYLTEEFDEEDRSLSEVDGLDDSDENDETDELENSATEFDDDATIEDDAEFEEEIDESDEEIENQIDEINDIDFDEEEIDAPDVVTEEEIAETEKAQEEELAHIEAAEEEKKPQRRLSEYKIPTDLLEKFENDEYWLIDDETKAAGENLKQTLNEFGIEAEVTGIRKGPVVTMFELLPAPGVKLSKIVNLQDNIALALAAKSVRIVAPIPGKHAVGIEIPNKERAIVSFREIIEQPLPEFKKMAVPVILGKDISGQSQIIDIAKTPHLLIAGATGAGKSVCVNSIILSILYNRSPRDVKLIMVDPKVVELKLYNDIPHLLTPVVTEPKRALQVLQYCICEMERRYALLDGMGVRDIVSYNTRIRERNIATEKLPYIVVIIDEFADLMATSGKELETNVARLTAMSRAVGIHLVLATQRPSVNVITGLIKANIPSRIAFMVASRTDSNIIIDATGAEKLLGKGDMLYTSAVNPIPTRIQGTLVGDNEVERVVEYVKSFGGPDYIDDEIFVDDDEEGDDEPGLFSDGEDPLYDQALQIVVQAGKASASYIQRRLKIGYNRAARLVEEMEERGIVGPANGSKPREVIHVP